MSENLPKLNVRMLGGFSIAYGDTPLSFGRNIVTKAMKLLQILIYRGSGGITRNQLLEELYGREELTDAANSLRVTVYRLKKLLPTLGLPECNYVNIKKGIYKWDVPMETELDVTVFEQLLDKAKDTDDEEEQIEMLRKACRMYGGDFLPELSGDDWALMESIHYKKRYSEALGELCEKLMARQEYEEVLELTAIACERYPFDEWQAIRMDCYIATNRYKDAMKEYEDTAKKFFEELGIAPSEKMMKQFESMSSRMSANPQVITDIKARLKEEEKKAGAFFCNLPSFRDNYRLIARIVERNKQSAFLMLLSITTSKGQPMENEAKLEILAQNLQRTIMRCLRSGDTFTKYNQSQFLILLVGANQENCGLIFDRIKKYFAREHKSWGQHLEYFASSVVDVNNERVPIPFEDQKSTWK